MKNLLKKARRIKVKRPYALAGGELRVSLPRSWEELTGEQFMIVVKYMSGHLSSLTARIALFFALSRIEVLAPAPGGGHFCRYHRRGRVVRILPEEVQFFLSDLDWLAFPASQPWRPKLPRRMERHLTPIEDDFASLSFGDWLEIDSFYTGWIHTEDDELLQQLAFLLFRPTTRGARSMMTEPWVSVAVPVWINSVKRRLYARFPNLYAGGGGDDQPFSGQAFRRSVDTQIRALTHGDPTKEDAVYSLNLYRALTELDAQAREAAEMRAAMKK